MTINFTLFYKILIVNLLFISFTNASDGDRSVFYQKCVKNCRTANCTSEGQSYAIEQLDFYTKLLWSCVDDCKYDCMWKTAEGFQERGYPIPKFHGKWPFKRIFGVQEPASAFASLLNLISHLYMQLKIYQEIPVRSTPIVLLWFLFAGVMVNGWIWSTIFHTRDTPFTEFMDYASALLMIKALYVAAIMRVFHRTRKFAAVILLPSIPYYISHVVYLYSGQIDYQYNMMVNGVFAAIGLSTWLIWANIQYISGKRYAWRMIAFSLLSTAAMSFEVADFPPYWGWDAHAMWHLSTAFLPLLFYRYVIEDLKYLQNEYVNLITDGSKYQKIR